MKDKEKQIEEMANILCESKEHNCNGEDCKCLKQATDLFNKSVRIIPEDSVVISKEEYDKLKYTFNCGYPVYKQGLEEGSKETAEKFKSFIFSEKTLKSQDFIEQGVIILFEDDIKDFIKQFDIEIKE